MIEKGNINEASKLLTNNISNVVLSLVDKKLKFLKQEQPMARELTEEIILSGKNPLVHPVIFEDINEDMIKIAAMKTKEGQIHLG